MQQFNGSLEFLDLCSAKLNPQGAAQLAAGIAQNRTLRTLRLSHNPIGDAGAASLAVGLRRNATLTALALNGADVGAAGAAALGAALAGDGGSGLQSLDLQNNAIGEAGAVSEREGRPRWGVAPLPPLFLFVCLKN